MGANDVTQTGTVEPTKQEVPPPIQTTDTRSDAEKLSDAQAELAKLRGEDVKEEVSEQTAQVASESDAEKIRRLENELTAKSAVSQVPASSTSIGITDPSITLGSIEPGIKWGIRQGLIDPSQFGEHIVKAFENGEL